MNFDMFLPYVSRLVASAVAAGVAVVARKVGVDSVDPSVATGLGTFLTAAVYSLTHRLIDKRINPGDVARPSTVTVLNKATSVAFDKDSVGI